MVLLGLVNVFRRRWIYYLALIIFDRNTEACRWLQQRYLKICVGNLALDLLIYSNFIIAGNGTEQVGLVLLRTLVIILLCVLILLLKRRAIGLRCINSVQTRIAQPHTARLVLMCIVCV